MMSASSLVETEKQRRLLLQGCVQFYAAGVGPRKMTPPVGFGALIHERGIVVTCLHVISQALSGRKDLSTSEFLQQWNSSGKPPTTIEVAYLVDGSTVLLTASMLAVPRLLDMDICLLELQERPPLEAVVLPLLSSDKADATRDGCEVPDFVLSQDKNGSWLEELRTVPGTLSIDPGKPGSARLRLSGRAFREGHSGAPLFSLSHGRVCGILCRTVETNEYATAVPIEDIIDAAPDTLRLSCRPPAPPRLFALLQREQDLALDKLHKSLKDLDRSLLLSYLAALSPSVSTSIATALKALPSRSTENLAQQFASEPELARGCVLLLRMSDTARTKEVGWQAIHAWSRLATEALRTGHSPPASAEWAALCGMLEALLEEKQIAPAGQTASKEAEQLAEIIAETIGLIGERELSFSQEAIEKVVDRVLRWVAQGRTLLGNRAVKKAGAELSIITGSCHRSLGRLEQALVAYDEALEHLRTLNSAEARIDQLGVRQRKVVVGDGHSSELLHLSMGILELLGTLREQPELLLVFADRLPHQVGLLALAVAQRLNGEQNVETAMELAVTAYGLFERTQSLRSAADAQLLIGRLWRARAEREGAVPAHKAAARAAFCSARSLYQRSAHLHGVALADRDLLLLALFTNSLTTAASRARACADMEKLIGLFGMQFKDEAAEAVLRVLFGRFLLDSSKLADARGQLVKARAYFAKEFSQHVAVLGGITEALISVYAREGSTQEVMREYDDWNVSPPAGQYKLKDEAQRLYAWASDELRSRLPPGDYRQALYLDYQGLTAQLCMDMPESAEINMRISRIGRILLHSFDRLDLAEKLLRARPNEAVQIIEGFLSNTAVR